MKIQIGGKNNVQDSDDPNEFCISQSAINKILTVIALGVGMLFIYKTLL